MKEITTCEVCKTPALNSVLDLGSHVLCDDLREIGSREIQKTYPIEILFCEVCKTAHQRYQIPRETLFPRDYHYRAHQTGDVLAGMRGLVESVESSLGRLANKRVLDIGCNDGSLLDFFKAKGALTFGVEPTLAALEAANNHRVINAYFDAKLREVLREIAPEIITFTNVFAHIEDLDSLLENLRAIALPATTIVIENHYLGAVLAKRQFDTFYHEHPRTYSLESFRFIAKNLGREIVKVEFVERYGGNIRVFLGRESLGSRGALAGEIRAGAAGADSPRFAQNCTPRFAPSLAHGEADFGAGFASLREFIAAWQGAKRAEIDHLVAEFGALSAKAFPGRAAILLKMLELDSPQIEAIFEKPGSKKIGFYAPGTSIPILDEAGLFSRDHEIVLNLAWHISGEIHHYLRDNAAKNGVKIRRIVDIC